MSLVFDAMEDFVIVSQSATDDGFGGICVQETDSQPFKASICYGSSKQVQIALINDVSVVATIYTDDSVYLGYRAIIKRVSDNKRFRILSDSKDNKTPMLSRLHLREYTAEELSHD